MFDGKLLRMILPEDRGDFLAAMQDHLVYIFENNEDNTACSNTFEWCNEGITPEKENLQNVSYIDDISGWPDVFDERGIFYCTDITALRHHFRAILEPQGIKSMLQAADLRSVLDRQDAWIYVIDPDTCELKFLNAKTKQNAPESREGMVCYKAFMNRDSRCESAGGEE